MDQLLLPRRGRNKSAQGNALGSVVVIADSPERAKQKPRMLRPFRADGTAHVSFPRALPWADLSPPLRGSGSRLLFATRLVMEATSSGSEWSVIVPDNSPICLIDVQYGPYPSSPAGTGHSMADNSANARNNACVPLRPRPWACSER
jgi:hypothetical protein